VLPLQVSIWPFSRSSSRKSRATPPEQVEGLEGLEAGMGGWRMNQEAPDAGKVEAEALLESHG